MTPNELLLTLEAAAYRNFDENLVPVDAGMASRVFPDGHVTTVCYSPEEGWEYSHSSIVGGRPGVYPVRSLCLFDIEARMPAVAI